MHHSFIHSWFFSTICAYVPSYDEEYGTRHIETVDAHSYYTRFSAVKTKSILTPSFPSTTRSSPFFCPHFSLLYSKYPCKTWFPISLSFTLLPFSTWHILLRFVFLCPPPPLSLSFSLFSLSFRFSQHPGHAEYHSCGWSQHFH